MTVLRAAFTPSLKAAADVIPPRSQDVVYADLPDSGFWSGALRLAPDYSASYEEIVRTQLWARIAVNKIAYAIGRLPLKVYQRDAAEVQRERAGPLAELLARPNDTKASGTLPGFLARVAYDLLVYGNAIIVKAQTSPSTAPMALLPSCPRYWTLDADGAYCYQRPHQSAPATYAPWEVLHIIEPGPTSNGFGRSRLEAARLTLAIEYAAQRLGEATFNNGARPSSIITLKNGIPVGRGDTADNAVKRFKAEVLARFGGVAKSGVPAVLEGDVDWQTVAHNLDESAVVAHRQLTRGEIAALYDIPQPAMGILDEANFASVDMLHVMFYQDTLSWPLKLIESTINAQLVRDVTAYAGQFVEFDLRAAMRGAHQERMAGYNIGINAGIYTRNEVRTLENLPPSEQEEADLLMFPLNYGTSSALPGKPLVP